jgi:hypothetical protein
MLTAQRNALERIARGEFTDANEAMKTLAGAILEPAELTPASLDRRMDAVVNNVTTYMARIGVLEDAVRRLIAEVKLPPDKDDDQAENQKGPGAGAQPAEDPGQVAG